MYGVFDPPVLPDGFRKQGDILFQTGNNKSLLDGGFTPDRSLGLTRPISDRFFQGAVDGSSEISSVIQ